jgi:hypothetical protein
MRVFACLLLLGALAHAADLSKIDRKIAALPKFGAERQFYALLVLGPEATTKVWFVVDGENLYVDRNGNGDLTDDGGPFRATASSQGTFVPVSRSWKVGTLAVSPRYSDVDVSVAMVNPSWRPAPTASNRERMEDFMAVAGRIPHVNLSSIRVTIDGKRQQFGHAMFRTSPAEAPVFHLDAPLTLGLVESIVPTVLKRGQELDLTLAAGTPGFSADHSGCFSYLMYAELPADARPVAVVEFPAANPGEYLPPVRITLDDKC